jgi:hypothetical protein
MSGKNILLLKHYKAIFPGAAEGPHLILVPSPSHLIALPALQSYHLKKLKQQR